jgi:chemotaxis protein MotB
MRWTSALVVSGILLAVLTSGCTTTQQGAAVGGAIGMTTGAIWANQEGILTSWEGGGVGLAVGGLAGALIGDALDEVNSKKREQELQTRLAALEGELQGKDVTVAGMQSELDKVKAELGQKQPQVQVETKNGQIRFTILNEVLYDAGKSELKGDGLAILDSVLDVVQKEYADRKVMIEGHTDSDPIKQSNWPSNWELSSARSMAVLHYLITKKGVAPERLSAAAFGEFRPVAPNDTDANKRLNRRAVIVVQPPESSLIVDKK